MKVKVSIKKLLFPDKFCDKSGYFQITQLALLKISNIYFFLILFVRSKTQNIMGRKNHIKTEEWGKQGLSGTDNL